MKDMRCFALAVIPDYRNHLLSDMLIINVCVFVCDCRSVESALWGRTLQTTVGFAKHIRLVCRKSTKPRVAFMTVMSNLQ